MCMLDIVHLWPAMEAPTSELSISLDQLSEPEAEGGRLPREPLPGERNSGVVHRVEQDPQVIAHHDRTFDGELHVGQVIAYCKNAKAPFVHSLEHVQIHNKKLPWARHV